MTVTIGIWWIPAYLTAVMLCIMLRPYRQSGDYDFGMIFRAFWLLPIFALLAVYFGLIVWLKR